MNTDLIIACIGLAFGAGLILWIVTTARQFQRSYRHDGRFAGRRYDCRLQWSYAEGTTRCSLGADQSALYLFGPSTTWSGALKHDLRIPWTDLEWRPRKILFLNEMRFYVPSKRMHFHVPRDIGESLLADAGRGAQPR